MKLWKIFGLLILLQIFLAVNVYANFDLYGYAKFTNGSVMNATNISVTTYNMTGGLSSLAVDTALSSETGYFNASNITTYTDENTTALYQIIIKHFNDTSNVYVDYIGPSLPSLPGSEVSNLSVSSNLTFYLKEGATINLSAVNGTDHATLQPFYYIVKDQTLGYAISEQFTSYVTNPMIHVPAARAYSIMIYPNNSFPVSVDVDATYVNNSEVYIKNFNCTENNIRLEGYILNSTDEANYTGMGIVVYLIEPGKMVYGGSALQFNVSNNDEYNASSGFYNISLPAPKEGADLLVFATVYNQSGDGLYYGGFRNITVAYDTANTSDFNFTAYPLLGQQSNITLKNTTGINVTIETKQVSFTLLNATNGTFSDFAHIEFEVNYSDYSQSEFTWMIDVSQTSSGAFTVPLLNASVPKVNIFAMAAPMKTKFTTAQLAEGGTAAINITTKTFDPGAIDGTALSLYVDMTANNATCDVPNYASGCSYFSGGEQASTAFNPIAVVFSGAPLSFRMRSSENITVHYVNVDLLASGPPDAMFDDDASNTTSSTTFEQAWRFGSTGPDIYDYIIIGAPYVEATSARTGFNESADITVSIPYLYDDNWNVIWNQSAGDNTTNLTTSAGLAEYADYVTNTSFSALVNGTDVICNSSDSTLAAGLCYQDTTNDVVWVKVLHFSGLGPTLTGDILKANAASCSAASECVGGYCVHSLCRSYSTHCGDGYCDTAETAISCSTDCAADNTDVTAAAESTTATVTQTFSSIAANTVASFSMNRANLPLTKIGFKLDTSASNVQIVVQSLGSKPSATNTPAQSVYKYIQISATNLADSTIDSAYIEFEIDKSWLEGTGINKNDISLLRWGDNRWNTLTTTYVSGADLLKFRATTPGFSYFAIAGKEAAGDTTTTPTVQETVEAPAEEEESIFAPPETEEEENIATNTSVIIGVLMVALMMMYIFYNRSVKKGKSVSLGSKFESGKKKKK